MTAGHRQVALVTGASRGLGRSLAQHLTAHDLDVMGLGRDRDALRDTAAGVPGPGQFTAMPSPSLDRAELELAVRGLGRLDYCFANAGVATRGSIIDSMDTDWRAVFETNVLGALHTIQVAGEVMVRAGSGTIVVVGSTASETGIPGMGAYVSSKHAVLGLARTAAAEFSSLGVRVTTVFPGSIATTILPTDAEQHYMSADDAASTIVAAVLSAGASAHLSELHLDPWG